MKKHNYSLWSMVVIFALAAFAPIELAYRYYILALLPLYVGVLNLNILKKSLYFGENERKLQIFIDRYGQKNGLILFIVMFVVLPIIFTALIAYNGYKLS